MCVRSSVGRRLERMSRVGMFVVVGCGGVETVSEMDCGVAAGCLGRRRRDRGARVEGLGRCSASCFEVEDLG